MVPVKARDKIRYRDTNSGEREKGGGGGGGERGGREGERERERERETDRQTDRQTDRDRKKQRQKKGLKNRSRDKDKNKVLDRRLEGRYDIATQFHGHISIFYLFLSLKKENQTICKISCFIDQRKQQ